MSSRIGVILAKEWLEMRGNRLLIFTIILPPIIMTILPLVMLAVGGRQPMRPEQLEQLYAIQPSLRLLNPEQVTQITILSQFLILFLLMPAIIPMTIASFSIIGEKQSRSLEPLLATPIEVNELFWGKSLAAALPAIGVTWASYAIFVVGSLFLASPVVWAQVVAWRWLAMILLLSPVISLLSVNLGVIISSRVNDTRVAQQIGGVIVVPVLLLLFAQLAGVIAIGLETILMALVALGALDYALIGVGARLFQRETILTRWR